ncbi:unnamed protein product [Leuciscus chuanchicus]
MASGEEALNPKLELPTNNIPPGEPSAPNKNHYGVQGRTRRQLALRTCDPCHFVDLTLVIVSKACRGAAVTVPPAWGRVDGRQEGRPHVRPLNASASAMVKLPL